MSDKFGIVSVPSGFGVCGGAVCCGAIAVILWFEQSRLRCRLNRATGKKAIEWLFFGLELFNQF
jgi:hypothetical protein